MDLLAEAWLKCGEARGYYADVQLHKYYSERGRLEIRRLSGDLLDMNQCYINLAIIEHIREAEKQASDDRKMEQSAFTLFSRLKVQAPNADKNVILPKLFDERKGQDGTMDRPRRILIRGRAGVGKTTLCKKIVHDFLHAQLWAELFDRILWVPLRSLKGRSSLENLLHEEYITQQSDRDCLVEVLRETIFDPENARTLLLLDGLDEISGEQHVSGTDLDENFTELLNQQNVIITSRPYAVNLPSLKQFDLEVETIGFHPFQVQDYVAKVVNDQATAEEIQAFIGSHLLIQGLVQIPIQLDALCYSWHNDLGSAGGLKTMTALYTAIELKLWKKDILRVKRNGAQLSEHEAGKLRLRRQIKSKITNEIEFVEFLAFTGLVNDIIEFNQDIRDQVYKQPQISDVSDDILDRISFLRTSDPLSGRENRSYHFLHLTFQEFFAAQYFIRCWTSDTPDKLLIYLKFGPENQQSATQIPPERFLQQEKYGGRYDIFWRFVVGLLWDKDREQLRRFFEQIEAEPRDLLGPAHQRLLMHCFGEVPQSESKSLFGDPGDLRGEMERQCKQWSMYEYKRLKQMLLCRESEFPDQVLSKMLTEVSDMRVCILQALLSRSQLPSHVLEEIVNISKVDGDEAVRWSAVEALAKQPSLSESIIQTLVSRLGHGDGNIRQSALEALAKHAFLSESILQVLVSRLEHNDGDIRWSAIEALAKQPSLSESILQALVLRLEDNDRDVRQSAIEALAKQPSLSESILHALVSRLEDSDWNVRQSAVEALNTDFFYSMLPTLPTHTLQILYRSWVVRSLREQISCYIQDGNMYIEMPHYRKEIALQQRKDDVKMKFLTEASAMGTPRLR
ncbi:hypothetical protein N7463_008692 [Penicillium fimorum]|uniref:NACHT domain-containing protein n=1 Tax=Penicillium fimorum TaxID=1882269 RepID=A0A9X0C3Z8_9EURO|nr:hypothetical protein N7463_008692 [Penicillium fimorum]